MVDFILEKEFINPPGVAQAGKGNKLSTENILLSAYVYHQEDKIIYVGLTNGKIYIYKAKSSEAKSMFAKGKDPEITLLESSSPHRGEIRKMICTKINEESLDVLFTASADRTIKMWDPKNTKGNCCIQTMCGHEGTILDMVYISKVPVDHLITTSTDKTMRIWVIDSSRQLMQYPWFVIHQKVTDFTSINQQLDVDTWINCLEVNETEKLGIYAGDSEGSLLKFKAPDTWRGSKKENQKVEFLFEYKKRGIHRFGLSQILHCKKESCTFTIGFDQMIRGYGASLDVPQKLPMKQAPSSQPKEEREDFFSMANPNKCLYTSICWDDQTQKLYLADELGYVYIANIYLGPQFTIQKHLFTNDRNEKKDSKKMGGFDEKTSKIGVKIKKIEIFKEHLRQTLFVFTERGMRAYRIKLGQQTQDIEGHTDSILNIVALDPSRLGQKTDQTIKDKPKLITCSLDRTIKLWDSKDMEVVTTLELEKSEPSCMCFLENCCLVATGQEDGSIRLWNLEISSSVVLKSQKGFKHTNSISCIISETTVDDEYLIAGSYDGQISIWEIAQKEQGGKDGQNISTTIYPQFNQHIDNRRHLTLDDKESDEILCLYYFRDESSSFIIVGGNSAKINVYKRKGNTFDYYCTLVGHENSVTCMTRDGYILFTGSDDCSIILWNTNDFYSVSNQDTNRIVLLHKQLKMHTESVQALLILPNGILLSCAYDHMIYAWQYQTGTVLHKYEKKNEELRCMDFIGKQYDDDSEEEDYDEDSYDEQQDENGGAEGSNVDSMSQQVKRKQKQITGKIDRYMQKSKLIKKKNPNQSKLFVGTNQNGLIITIDINELLEYENNVDDVQQEFGMSVQSQRQQQMNDRFEEEKQPYDDSYNVPDFGQSDNMNVLKQLTKNQKNIMANQR